MPIVAIYRSDSVTPEQFRAFRAEAPIDAAPREALAHLHAQMSKGFVSIDVWDNRAALQRFIDGVLKPAAARSGLPFTEPEVLDLDTFIVTPDANAFVIPFLQAETA